MQSHDMLQRRQAGTHAGERGDDEEDRLVENLALASAVGSTLRCTG